MRKFLLCTYIRSSRTQCSQANTIQRTSSMYNIHCIYVLYKCTYTKQISFIIAHGSYEKARTDTFHTMRKATLKLSDAKCQNSAGKN